MALLAISKAILDCDVLAVDKSGFTQAPLPRCYQMACLPLRERAQKCRYRHRWLLRARRERPRSGAAEKANELTSLHNSPKLRGQHCIG
jgi:hypothetical protein